MNDETENLESNDDAAMDDWAAAMAEQAEVLDRFRTQIASALRAPGGTASALKRVRDVITLFPKQRIDWATIESEFTRSHPDFTARLTARYPSLTRQQVRICLLILLNLKAHEIARLTCVTERTIEKHRLNIRGILKLRRGDDLASALKALDEGEGG